MEVIKREEEQVYRLKHSNGIDAIDVDIYEYENNKEVKRYAIFLLNEKALKREFNKTND